MDRRKTELKDLLHDEEFNRWALKPTIDSDRYWKAWIEAHPECKEDVQKAKELILSFNFKIEKPQVSEKQEVLEKILKDVNQANLRSSPNGTRRWVLITSIAASIALLFLFLFDFNSKNNTEGTTMTLDLEQEIIKQAPTGIKIQTVLPDGSKVWINSGSKISYGPDYGQTVRNVYLVGEAFFEVEKDENLPFIVYSGKLKITALGTSFNVNSLKSHNTSVVALVTGKVEVIKDSDTEKEIVILTPGQKVTHNFLSSSFIRSSFSFNQEIGWKNGILSFEHAGFDEIKEELEKWYGVSIEAKKIDILNWDYTGKFDNQSMEMVLERMAYSKNFKFNIEDKKVLLYN